MYLNHEVLTLNQLGTAQVRPTSAVLTEAKKPRLKKRKLLSVLQKHLLGNRFLIVGGGYRTGKSALMTQLYSSSLDAGLPAYYINFSDFEIAEAVNLNPDNLFKYIPRVLNRKTYVIIDDIDMLTDPMKTLGYWFDYYGDMLMVAASAGSNFWGTPENTAALSRRARFFKLRTLDFEEFLYFKNHDRLLAVHTKMSNNQPVALSDKHKLYELFAEYAVWGGFPQVVLAATEAEKRKALTNIYAIIMENSLPVGSNTGVHHLAYAFRILAQENGGKLVHSEIAKAADLSLRELNIFIAYLQSRFLLDIISPFHSNEGDETRKTPLAYFTDNGLRNIILNKFESFAGRNDKAALTKAILLQKLRKNYPSAEIRYWRTVRNKSADFVVQAAYNVNLAFRVKSSCMITYPRKQEAFTERYPGFLFHAVSFHPECPDAKPIWIM